MVDKAKQKRDQAKCSECRQQRIKCPPSDRDWDANQQICDNCIRRGRECGPSRRKKDDPVANPSSDNEDSSEPASSSSTQQSILQSLQEGHAFQDDQYMETASHEGRKGKKPSNDREDHSAFTSEEFKRKLCSKFEKLIDAGNDWKHASIGTPTHCGASHTYGYQKPRLTTSKLKDEFHTLFITIFNMILELDGQGYQDLANGQMTKLLLALHKYPELCDDEKRGALLDMAAFFKKNGVRDEYEYVLGKVADMPDPSILPTDQEDPCHLLAECFLENKNQGLAKFCEKHFEKSNMPSHPVIPALQRAVRYRNPNIAKFILSQRNSIKSAPAIFNLEPLHIAAAPDNVDTLATLIDMADGRNVDARDTQLRTPLFLAAAYGRQNCCSLLLQRKADPHSRDWHGHTILEVAAKSGNLTIVKMLLKWGAKLNAPVVHCASTPVQAAIESGDPSGELVQYILNQGVDVSAQRGHDKETAMSLAEGQGLHKLALQISGIMAEQQQVLFRPY